MLASIQKPNTTQIYQIVLFSHAYHMNITAITPLSLCHGHFFHHNDVSTPYVVTTLQALNHIPLPPLRYCCIQTFAMPRTLLLYFWSLPCHLTIHQPSLCIPCHCHHVLWLSYYTWHPMQCYCELWRCIEGIVQYLNKILQCNIHDCCHLSGPLLQIMCMPRWGFKPQQVNTQRWTKMKDLTQPIRTTFVGNVNVRVVEYVSSQT